jgi:serine/threonine protein kinase
MVTLGDPDEQQVGSRSMIGETLGSYRIVSEIGKGGMGVVYLAEHNVIGRKAALKLLRADCASEQVERFLNEARAAAKLHHSGIVETFDFGHTKDGNAFIVMEFLAGESLAERLDREPKLKPVVALTIARAVASALRVAHEQGIVHRDLKPANIFLCDDPDSPIGIRAKVLDFGIAKLTRDDVPSSVMTNSGAVIGTPRYMSPEQCKNARAVDGRTDIYSLGCILFEMVLGTPPFDYDNWAELVGAHLHEEPPRPTELDAAIRPDLEDLIMRMMTKDPDDRIQTMSELAMAIDEVLRASGVPISRPTPMAGVQQLPSQPRIRVSTPPHGTPRASSQPRAGTDPTPSRRASSQRSNTAIDDTMPSPILRTDPDLAAARSLGTQPGIVEPRRSNTPLILGALAMVLIAGVAITYVVTRKSESDVVVVKPEAQPRTDLQDPPPPPADAAAAAVDAAELTVATDAAAAKPIKPLTTEQLRVNRLTQVFSARAAKLNACFGEAERPSGIEIKVTISEAGTVTAAQVSPASLPQAACLAQVARDTQFGAQPSGITMTFPLRAAKR